MDLEELKAQALEYWEIAVEYLSHPELLFQVGLIVVLFLPAWFLSTRVEPLLEQQARKIRGMPVFPQVHRDPVGAGPLAGSGGLHRIGLVGAPGLSHRRHMIDVDVETHGPLAPPIGSV